MDDVMQIAHARREDLLEAISEYEDEIKKLQGEVEALEQFVKFGDKLRLTAQSEEVEDALSEDENDNIEPLRHPA